MNNIRKSISLAIAVLLLFALATTQESLVVEALDAAQEDPENHIFVDVTYDPVSKTYSLIGLSQDQLKQLGLPELQGMLWTILERFESLSLDVGSEGVHLKTNEAELATINWDKDSRELIMGLLDSYGMNLSPVSKERVETWVETTDIELKVRNSPYISEPLVLDLSTLLLVDINQEGKVAVEGFDTGVVLQPEIYDMAKTGDIENAMLCWNDGTLNTQVNGNSLPEIQIYQEGIEVIDKALGLNLGDIEQFLASQIGASISIDGSEHLSSQCGD